MTTEEFSDRARFFFTRIIDGDVKGVGEFIDNEKIAPFNNEKDESAAAVALKSKQLTVYEALVSRGWCLNSNENFNEIVNELEKKLKKEILEILKEFIKNPKDEDHLKTLINTFLDRNRYILFNNLDEGKLLLADNIKLRRKKDIEKIIAQFQSALKCELREIHKRHFIKNPNEEHLTALITRTSIYFGGSSATTNRPKYLALIAGAYEQLNEVPEIKAIFKVLANIKNLEIIFDFKRYSVEHADATGNENIYGRSYAKEGIVYLGAKALNEENQNEELEDCSEISIHETEEPLLDDDVDDKPSRSEALGVLAHELCHVAIFRIYNNDCKPYHSDDSKSLKEFESALQHCSENRFTEEIIALALNGPEDVVHDELIVRVPHLLVLYQGDNAKIKSLRETFKKLFDFFEKKTLRDLEEEIELMSAVWKLKSKEPQHLTDQKILIRPRTNELVLDSSKVHEISSNCPQMTLNLIFQEMSCQSSFIFLSIYHLKDMETWDLMLNAHSSCMKPRIVIGCDNETEKEIVKIAKELRGDEINERIIFVHNHKKPLIKDATFIEISHSWSELMDKSKENLIKKIISFQGEKLLLNEVVDLRCDALDFIPLKKLLDNNLAIDHDLEFLQVDIHVPRKFLNHKSEEIEPSQLINITKTSKLILLSDDPGMGKTTELKMLAVKFKKKFKHYWISFVDLKEHSDFFERDENFKTTFNTPEEIASFFATEIFKLNEFEKKVYKHLFCQSRVCLLLDGFDEISPSFKKFVKMLITSIKTHSGNILITTTRPHFKIELCNEFNVEAYTLKPLTSKMCEEILELSFGKLKVTGDDLDKKLSKTKEFSKKLNNNSDPVMNPLILRMIAKVFTNDEAAQVTQPNNFSIYENFIKMMIKESLNRGDDAQQEAASYFMSEFNIMPFHHSEAFKILFENFDDLTVSCSDLCFGEVQYPHDDQITRIALLKSHGLRKFHFIHRTFAEFFIADFLFKNLFDVKTLKERKQKVPVNRKRLEAIYEIFRKIFFPGTSKAFYFPVRSFIDGAFEKLIADVEDLEKEVLLSTFYEIFQHFLFPKFFRDVFVTESLLNLVTVITRCAKKREVRRLWIEQAHTGFWVENMFSKHEINNVFMRAAERGSLYFNTKLTELARDEKVLDRKDFLNFFTEKNVDGDTVFSIAVKKSRIPEVINFYFESELIPSPTDQFSSDELNFKEQASIVSLIRKKDIVKLRNELDQIKVKYGLQSLQRFLNSWTFGGGSIYFGACQYLSRIQDFGMFWNLLRDILDENDFKSLLKKPNRRGWTPLMLAVNDTEIVFISFWRLISKGLTDEDKEKLLIEEDDRGWNLLELATRSTKYKTFIVIKDLYLRTFGKDRMKIMLARERKNGKSILLLSLLSADNIETQKALWTFIQEVCDVDTQKAILMKKDEHEMTYYGWSLKIRNSSERIKIFEPFIEQNLTAPEKEQFYSQYDSTLLKVTFRTKLADFITRTVQNNNRL